MTSPTKSVGVKKSGSGYKFYLHVTGATPLAIDTVINAKLTKDQQTLNLRLFKNGSELLETFYEENSH